LATIRQKKAKAILDRGECRTMKEVMKKAGYSESIIDKPKQKLMDSKGFKELEAENVQEYLNSGTADAKYIIQVALAQLQSDLEAGKLEDKVKLMLVKICSDLLKGNPELFEKLRASSAEEAIHTMRLRLRNK
jgi:hypothetical protein